jgi:hypothetical protein
MAASSSSDSEIIGKKQRRGNYESARHQPGDLSITLIGVAIDIGKALSVRVHDLEAAV